MTVSDRERDAPGVSRSGARRRWTAEEKLRIVAESEEPGSSVSMVARRHDLNANMLFTWRREFRPRAFGAGVDQVAFTPAVIAPAGSGGGRSAIAPQGHREGVEDCSLRRASGLMEIVLAGGERVIVDREVNTAALARVINVLERR
jgi:transposase